MKVPKVLFIITAILAVVMIVLFAFMVGRNTAPVEQTFNNNTTEVNTM